MPYGLKKFARFATEVWGIDPAGKSKEELANEGLEALKNWMQTIGVAMNLSELGVTENMIEAIADATILLDGGYKKLDRDDVVAVLKASL
jgi:alcohol dehydrogenase YqhD (iron-dependent ADH family)